jgi:hypothetical protein
MSARARQVTSDRKLAYHAEIRAQKAEAMVGQLVARVAELERGIAAHRDGDGWSDSDLWELLPRRMWRHRTSA